MEAGAEAERKEITQRKEEYERRVAEAKAEEEHLAREKEAMGVTWGLSEYQDSYCTTCTSYDM